MDPTASAYAKAEAFADKLRQERVLLLLDGVEPLQDASGDMKDQALKALLQELDTHNAGLVLCTTSIRLTDLPDDGDRARSWDLDNLSPAAGLAYLRRLGVKGEDDELQQASKDYGHHALALTLLGHYLVDFCEGDVRREVEIPKLMVDEVKHGGHARRVMAAYEKTFAGKPELDILKGLGYFDRPAELAALLLVLPPMAPRTSSRCRRCTPPTSSWASGASRAAPSGWSPTSPCPRPASSTSRRRRRPRGSCARVMRSTSRW